MTKPAEIYLKDYTAPDFFIDQVDLHVDLGDDQTEVRARLQLRRNPDRPATQPLRLDGQALELLQLCLDGTPLNAEQYQLDDHALTLADTPDQFELDIRTRIYPQRNASLEGLYQSSGNFCTQCEAEGFRKITYFLDRPDVMATYTTTLVADKNKYPVLLSNGNLTDSGEHDDGRHWATWHDPFKKPSYLFALVAGNLKFIEDKFITRSGREVTLRIYVEPHNIDQCEHAMRSLQKSMAWDEQRFGLEYDLDIYMIVAVGDFNMGAMENKGLNVFNTKYVLAKPETATDADYQNIEGVIAHEYFHNWTGNRVTCRDWFQLSLKEGLTVFRDQEFSGDMGSHGVKRIDDVRILRSVQFPQDAGPMAHPIRPDAYIEINNFYTVTVYNKGAEVIRMMNTLLSQDGFRRGMDLYFQRHDGEAVTCEDFVSAMEDANGADFAQFRHWYDQAGTPELQVSGHYDASAERYTLTVKQQCPPTPGQTKKQPFHIPLAMGLLAADGSDLPLQLAGENAPSDSATRVLDLREPEQTFEFINVTSAPVPSLLRGFSAPVKLNYDYSDADLQFLLAHDSDDFNRWEAAQQLIVRTILKMLAEPEPSWQLPDSIVSAFAKALSDTDADPALLAQVLTLPSEAYLAEQMTPVDVDGIHAARQFIRKSLAETLQAPFLASYQNHSDSGDYRIDNVAIGRRSLKNRCLDYLVQLNQPRWRTLALDQIRDARNMSDEISALASLASIDCAEREPALNDFYQRWQDEALVVDKWFSLQAGTALPTTLTRVKSLLDHEAFTLKNPNKVRALIGAFSHNHVCFHAIDGSGYNFLADQVLTLDSFNPQVAARLLGTFTHWRKYDRQRQEQMRTQLKRLLDAAKLSPDVYEIAAKSIDA